MKHLLTLIIGFSCTVTIYADCSRAGLSVFPNGQTIKQNPVFIIDGYAESQNIILQLNKKHDVYLKSGSKKVKLSVTEICVGQFHLTQAILKPETELEAGLEYTIYIDSLPYYERFKKYNWETRRYEPITYKVITEKDTDKPLLPTKPKESGKELTHYGCGSSIHVVFSNPAKDESEIAVKTTVKNLKSGEEATYYIIPSKAHIYVGHNMCSGAFNFDDNINYEVEFSFMDASGNITAWTGQRIKFTKPVNETNFYGE